MDILFKIWLQIIVRINLIYVTVIHHIEWNNFFIYGWAFSSKNHILWLFQNMLFLTSVKLNSLHMPRFYQRKNHCSFFLLLPHVYRTAAIYGCFWQLKGNTLTATLFGLPHKYSLSKYENHTIPIQSMYQRNLKNV